MSGLRMLACGNRADNSLRSHVILKQKLLKITYNYYNSFYHNIFYTKKTFNNNVQI